MRKIKTFLITILAMSLLFFMCIGFVTPALAEEMDEEPPSAEENIVDDETMADEVINGEVIDENSMPLLVERFNEYLKARYGEEYEYYYNKIMEKYGSIEQYLLSFTEKLPEEYQDGWTRFIAWLHQYSVVWVPTLIFIVLIAIAIAIKLIAKKFYNKGLNDFKKWLEGTVDKKVNDKLNEKLTPVAIELNLQSSAIGAIMRSQKLLMGNNEKFASAVKDLEDSEKELTKND